MCLYISVLISVQVAYSIELKGNETAIIKVRKQSLFFDNSAIRRPKRDRDKLSHTFKAMYTRVPASIKNSLYVY